MCVIYGFLQKEKRNKAMQLPINLFVVNSFLFLNIYILIAFIFLKKNMFSLLGIYQFREININTNFCSDMSWSVF